jgi:hypothetical protein
MGVGRAPLRDPMVETATARRPWVRCGGGPRRPIQRYRSKPIAVPAAGKSAMARHARAIDAVGRARLRNPMLETATAAGHGCPPAAVSVIRSSGIASIRLTFQMQGSRPWPGTGERSMGSVAESRAVFGWQSRAHRSASSGSGGGGSAYDDASNPFGFRARPGSRLPSQSAEAGALWAVRRSARSRRRQCSRAGTGPFRASASTRATWTASRPLPSRIC